MNNAKEVYLLVPRLSDRSCMFLYEWLRRNTKEDEVIIYS